MGSDRSLSQRLGYAADDIVVILNCDDLGSSLAANEAIADCLRDGVASSTTLMVPCPWSAHAAAHLPGDDVGVHLTLNAEWSGYRWSPLTAAPSLRDREGRFFSTVEETWNSADIDEVRVELRAQIEQALAWGVDVTHLDSHMGTLQINPRFFAVYLELAVEYALPVRVTGRATQQALGFAFRDEIDKAGVVAPDHLVVAMGPTILHSLRALRPGVTEFFFHPAADGRELRALAPDWQTRVDDVGYLAHGGPFARHLVDIGAHIISYRPLRDLQRA